MHTILVLGGYGFFGSRISQELATHQEIRLLIGGRNITRARALATALGLNPDQGIYIDAHAFNLAQHLENLSVNTVIHTAGPFQGQDYSVARAAISAGSNYIDLADGRDFVAGIENLNLDARERGVFVTSGASSVPALSAAVVDRYLQNFSHLESIQHGIGSGARSPGLATIRGIFGYCGKTFLRLEAGSWKNAYGWLDLIRYKFPAPVGTRLLGGCDVPDLILFPRRYTSVRTVRFHAGFASPTGHLFVWMAAQMVRFGLIRTLAPLASPLHAISKIIEPLVSDKGAMFVSLQGIGLDGNSLNLDWHLVASQNHGPYVPCGASISLAKKLAQGEKLPFGAMPCMGLLTVEDYLSALQGYNIRELPA